MFLDFYNLPAEEQAAVREKANGMLFAPAPQFGDASEDDLAAGSQPELDSNDSELELHSSNTIEAIA
jgi:hypothetical protein